jgi:hypothetical protein
MAIFERENLYKKGPLMEIGIRKQGMVIVSRICLYKRSVEKLQENQFWDVLSKFIVLLA